MGTNFPYYETYFDNLADKRNIAAPRENEVHVLLNFYIPLKFNCSPPDLVDNLIER